MNRRLLSTTLSLSALLAVATLASPRATFAQSSPVGAASVRALSGLLPMQAVDADVEYNLGINDYNDNKFDSAIAHFTAALKARSSFSDANLSRGLAYEGKKDWKSAIADFTKVIAKKPMMYDAYVERGRCYEANGDFADAQTDLTKAQSLKPNRSDAFQVLGDAYFNQKQYDNAVASYTKYLAVEPKPDPLVYNNRGLANFSGKHYAEAITDFKKFTTLDAKDAADTSLFLGDSYSQMKQYPAAVAAYTSYISSHPNDATGAALKSRAIAQYQAMQYKESAADFKAYLAVHPDDKEASTSYVAALQKVPGGASRSVLEAAVAKDPTNVALLISLANAQFADKAYAASIATYTKVLVAKPDETASMFNRGLAEAQVGDHAKATSDFLTYTKAKPDAEGYKELGLEYGQAGNWKAAAGAFTQGIALKPDDLEAYKNRGIAEYNLQDWKTAAVDLGKYDTAKPGDEQVGKLLSVALVNSNDLPAAIAHMKAVLAKNPNDGATWGNLGVAYVSAKDYTNAIEAFSKSIAIKSDDQMLFNRGLAYYNLGQTNPASYPKAVTDAKAALAAKPGYAQAQLLKADAEFSGKNMKDAQTDYATYITMPGISAESKQYAQTQSLKVAIESQNYQSVVTGTTALIATNPNDAGNYLLRGSSYAALKNYDMAIPDLTKYTTMKSDDESGFYNLGLAYSGKGDNANAATAYEKALALKPENYDAAFQAALAYKSLADADKADGTKAGPEYDKAIALFDKASMIKGSTKASAQADALYDEAQALEAKAKSTDTTDPLKTAVTVWAKYIAMAPNDPQIKTITAHVDALKAQIANE